MKSKSKDMGGGKSCNGSVGYSSGKGPGEKSKLPGDGMSSIARAPGHPMRKPTKSEAGKFVGSPKPVISRKAIR